MGVQKNEYTLLNGSPVELSFDVFRAMMEKSMFRIPTLKNIVRFDNTDRLLADVICVHETNNSGMISINYGNVQNVLEDRDICHDYYSLFLHKNYPLVVGGRILTSPGRVDIVLTDDDGENACPSVTGYTRFGSDIPGQKVDTRLVQIVRAGEISDFVSILSQKDQKLGVIAAPHLSKFSEDLGFLRKKGFIDCAYGLSEAWDDVSEEEKAKALRFQDEYEKVEGDACKNPIWGNEAITGQLSLYRMEIDCSSFDIEGSNAVLFENIFQDNVCLKRDFPIYMAEQADFWIESSVMGDILAEEFDITTSLLLTNIAPGDDGKVRIKVANKLVNDVRSDHGWYL